MVVEEPGRDGENDAHHGSLNERELLDSALIELERIAKEWKAQPQTPIEGERPLTDLQLLAKQMGFPSQVRLSKLYSRTRDKAPPWSVVEKLLEATSSDVHAYLGRHGSVFPDAPAFEVPDEATSTSESDGATENDNAAEMEQLRSELFVATARVRLLHENLWSEQRRGQAGLEREQQLSARIEALERAYADAERQRADEARARAQAESDVREALAALHQAETQARIATRARERAEDQQKLTEGDLRRARNRLGTLQRRNQVRSWVLPIVVAVLTVAALAAVLWARGML